MLLDYELLIVREASTEGDDSSNGKVATESSLDGDSRSLAKSTQNNLGRIHAFINLLLDQAVHIIAALLDALTLVVASFVPGREVELR